MTAKSRQRSYADKRNRKLEFQVGDKVFLRISPTKGVLRFGKIMKLNPRFMGPYEILDQVGEIAYRLALPPLLSEVHRVFHVSMLNKYVPDSSYILQHDPFQIDKDLSYEEQPIQILDCKIKDLHKNSISLAKVLWKN